MWDEFYVSLAEAHLQLQHRAYLMPVVAEWWRQQGWDVPPILHAGYAGIFARQLATYRYEDALFAHMCEQGHLTPLWCPYSGDRFSTHSSLKKSYVQPVYCSGLGRSGGPKTQKQKLVSDFQKINGMPLNQIVTDEGQSLVEFHLELHQRMTGGGSVQDLTTTLQQIGGAKEYYRFDMSVYLAHGVLFEDFHGGESGNKLDRFTTDVFEPAFHEITKRFGVKPLIVRMPWCPEMGYYPADASWRTHGVMDRVLASLSAQ